MTDLYLCLLLDQQTKRGGHHLGKRAKKLKSDGILVVRFEMPFHVTCMGCGKTIAKGVRFNAEKKKVGAYYSTSIYSFQMRAPCCSCVIEIRTDPKNTDYSVITGAKRKVSTIFPRSVNVDINKKSHASSLQLLLCCFFFYNW